MDKPNFQYNTFFVVSDISDITLNLSDARDITNLAQRFLAFDPGTRRHILYCSNVHRALLASGDINTLPYMPLCLLLPTNTGWL